MNLLVACLTMLLIGLSSEAFGQTAARREILQRPGYETVKLQRTGDDHLFVSGKINGRRGSVLIDTGWSYSTMNQNNAHKLSPIESIPADWKNFRPATNETMVCIESLFLGRVNLTNQPALAQKILMGGQPASFDLVLGCDFLFRHFAVIDCSNDRLLLRREAPTPLQQSELDKELQRAGYVAVNLSRSEPPGITCSTLVNGEPVEMLVDTAGVFSCLDARMIPSLGMKTIVSPRTLGGIGNTGKRNLRVTVVKEFSVGPVDWRRHHFAVLDLQEWNLGRAETGLQNVRGILGGPELATSHAVIDLHAQKLWVKRPKFR